MCNTCIHKILCSKYIATGGVKNCEHHREERNGRWIPNYEYDFDRGEHRLAGYHCDKCGIWTLKKSNYCPSCGADMRGNENG